ncbi:MAG TPA: hypothetical protein DEB06_01935 [Phycisphaerales bacterium]|nr:hypothetical protein [Phycisphaerales bacterium]
MLLTLSAKSFAVPAKKGAEPRVALHEIPRIAQTELGLMGLSIPSSMLAGWEPPALDRLRDQADKAACPVLLLIEDRPHAFGGADPQAFAATQERLDRVLRVAHRLGCASVAISLEHKPEPEISETLAQRLKALVSRAERIEINLLLAPAKGLTEAPDRLTGLIRRVGGFRIGSFPDYAAAAASDDAVAYLRSLAPYASVVSASFQEFDAKGKHKGWDLAACSQAIREVGFDANLTLDFRGKGDPVPALAQAKATIEAALGLEQDDEEPPDLDDILGPIAEDPEPADE